MQAWPDVLQAVTPDDVMQAAAELFDKRRSVTGYAMGVGENSGLGAPPQDAAAEDATDVPEGTAPAPATSPESAPAPAPAPEPAPAPQPIPEAGALPGAEEMTQ